MKKYTLILTTAACLFATSVFGASALVTMSGNITNVPVAIPGASFLLSSVTFSTVGLTNAAALDVYDSADTNIVSTSTSSWYSNSITITNWYQIWTNYYGVTNRATNIYVYTVTNTIPGFTNLWPKPFAAIPVASNSQVTLDGLSLRFTHGMLVSNTVAKTSCGVYVTVNYTQ